MREALGACPVCGGELGIREYACTDCGVSLRGDFRRCDLCNLSTDQLHFVRVFLRSEGNFKQIERELGISYPTVKSRLARINQRLGPSPAESQERQRLLQQFKEGSVSKEDLLANL